MLVLLGGRERGLVPGMGTAGLGGGGGLEVTTGAVLVRDRPDRRSRLEVLSAVEGLGGGRDGWWTVCTAGTGLG